MNTPSGRHEPSPRSALALVGIATQLRRAGAVIVIVTAVGCASSSPAGGNPGTSVTRSPNVITAEEISGTNVQNAYEAVQKLRPAMLRQRQVASANAQANGELAVYVDNNRMGSVDALLQISADSIAQVRYFSASEAQLRWGSGHPGGVIEVVTRR